MIIMFFSHQRQEVISTLTGHLGLLTSAEFCPWNKDILVTTSEDRTFRVLNQDPQKMELKALSHLSWKNWQYYALTFFRCGI